MALALTIASAVLLGYELSLLLWKSEDGPAPAERALYALGIGTMLWLASTWVILAAGLLRREVVLARTLLFLAAGLGLLMRRRPRVPQLQFEKRAVVLVLIALVPLVMWLDFVLWRAAISPPLNHDALSYHLPKAAMYVQAGGYRSLIDLGYVITPRPSNYEALLADAIVADGTDKFTEWPGVVFFLGFVLSGVVLAQRWWNCRLEALLATGLALAAVPVLLLHAGAHKNDLMFTFLAVTAMVAASRFLAGGDLASLALTVSSLAALSGTKRHGLIVAACLAPLLAWKLFRPFSAKRIAAAIGIAALSGLLLGGIDEIGRYTDARRIAAAPQQEQKGETASVTTYAYGDWENLWQTPWILLYSPFSPDPRSLAVPWLEQPMFWQRYELYFSHYGMHFTVAALFLPLALVLARRRNPVARSERIALTIAAFAAVLLLLPVHFVPRGLYVIYIPRFILFVVPVVFAWTVPLLVEAMSARRKELGTAVVVAGALLFASYAVTYAINDRFVPIEFVMWASEHPDSRVIPFFPNRAPSVVDRMAGPRDSIAFDAGQAAWLYPAYGEHLQRRVEYFPPGDGPPKVPDVDWIVIERSWNAIWGDPAFTDLSDARKFLVQGRVQPEDRRVLQAVKRDPRYEMVFNDARLRQAVFKRVR